MASVDLQKHTTQEACSGMTRHNYRESAGHSNKDIQPELSHMNKVYGCATGSEARRKLKKRIRKLDEEHPPQRVRADRKTCLSVVVWSPREGMTQEQEAAWADAAWGVLQDMFGDNLTDGVYHADEVHEYLGHDGEVHTSRGHLHADVLPWTEEHGLNMKHFYTRDLPTRINAALDAKSMEMFGFPYQDGTKQKSKGTVEELKAEEVIRKREEVRQAENKLDQAQLQYDFLDEQLKNKDQELKEAQEALQKTQDEKMTTESDLEALRGECEAMKGKLEKTEARAVAAEKKANEEEARLTSLFSRFKEKVAAWIKGHHDLERILRTAFWLSPQNAEKIEQRMEKTVERGGKALAKADESAESFLAANNELDKGIQDFSYLGTTVKKRQDIDIDALEDMDR